MYRTLRAQPLKAVDDAVGSGLAYVPVQGFQRIKAQIIVRIEEDIIVTLRALKRVAPGVHETAVRLMEHADAAVLFRVLLAYFAAVVG